MNAHIKHIMNMQTIDSNSPSRINEFFEKLVTHIQAFEKTGKVTDVNGYVWMMLEHLPVIRSDVVYDNNNWQE